MRRGCRLVALIVALLIVASLPAEAGVRDWIGRAFTPGVPIIGTAMTQPIPASQSGEMDIFVFSTIPGSDPMVRVRIPASDQRKLRKVQVGSTILVREPQLMMGENPDGVVLARRWDVREKGNPLRFDFLRTYRVPILFYAFRQDPKTLRFIFGDDVGAARQLAFDLKPLEATFSALGIDSPWGDPVETPASPAPAPLEKVQSDLKMCEDDLASAGGLLLDLSGALSRIEGMAQGMTCATRCDPSNPQDHHGDIDGVAASAQRLITNFLSGE